MKDDFCLTNDGAPAFQKADPSAFEPMSEAETTRQAIWKLLCAEPEKIFPLAELQKRLTQKRADLRAACRYLVRKGIASGSETKEPKPTKKDPEAGRFVIAVQYIAPFSTKLRRDCKK